MHCRAAVCSTLAAESAIVLLLVVRSSIGSASFVSKYVANGDVLTLYGFFICCFVQSWSLLRLYSCRTHTVNNVQTIDIAYYNYILQSFGRLETFKDEI